MSIEHDKVIADAREANPFVCVRCRYSLDGVPMDGERCVVCPECGYQMRFRVHVRLESNDPVYQKMVKKSLNRMDRVLSRMALVVFLLVGVAMVVIAMM